MPANGVNTTDLQPTFLLVTLLYTRVAAGLDGCGRYGPTSDDERRVRNEKKWQVSMALRTWCLCVEKPGNA